MVGEFVRARRDGEVGEPHHLGQLEQERGSRRSPRGRPAGCCRSARSRRPWATGSPSASAKGSRRSGLGATRSENRAGSRPARTRRAGRRCRRRSRRVRRGRRGSSSRAKRGGVATRERVEVAEGVHGRCEMAWVSAPRVPAMTAITAAAATIPLASRERANRPSFRNCSRRASVASCVRSSSDTVGGSPSKGRAAARRACCWGRGHGSLRPHGSVGVCAPRVLVARLRGRRQRGRGRRASRLYFSSP